jgi:hypothetical protein
MREIGRLFKPLFRLGPCWFDNFLDTQYTESAQYDRQLFERCNMLVAPPKHCCGFSAANPLIEKIGSIAVDCWQQIPWLVAGESATGDVSYGTDACDRVSDTFHVAGRAFP